MLTLYSTSSDGLDPMGYLYDAFQYHLDDYDDIQGADNRQFKLSNKLDARTYYIRVYGFNIGHYQLHVKFGNNSPTPLLIYLLD